MDRRAENARAIKQELVQLFGLQDKDRLNSEQDKLMQDVKSVIQSASSADREQIAKERSMSHYFGSWMSVAETVVTISTVVWLVLFIVFLAINKYNVRLDYNTNYLDRDSCPAHGDHVCQEVTFGRMHAVNLSWVILATLVAILVSEIKTVITVGALQFWGLINDMDKAVANVPPSDDYYMRSMWFTSGWIAFVLSPFRYLGRASYNQLTIWYNVRHVIFDPVAVGIVFALFGVRYDTKFYLFGGLALLWNFLIIAAQQVNYRSAAVLRVMMLADRLQTVDSAGLNVRRHYQARWMFPVLQFVAGSLLFSLLVVYFAKFPYDSRHWYQYFAALLVLINVALRSIFNLGRFVCYESRLNKPMPDDMTWFGSMVCACSQLLGMLARIFCTWPRFIQFVLTAYDVLYLFLFWIVVHGLEGHSNVARIVFPSNVILGF